MRPPESYVGQPIRSLQTMLQVVGKRYGDLPTVIPDGIFGPQTMTAVTAFQRRFGLPITGVADQNTWDAVVREYNTAVIQQNPAEPVQIILNPNQVLTAGSTSPYLYVAQAMLLVLHKGYGNFPAVQVTGVLDEQTAGGLRQIQRLSNLPVTGELDKVTWKHLSLQFTLCTNRM